jgi:hypothetical protein
MNNPYFESIPDDATLESLGRHSVRRKPRPLPRLLNMLFGWVVFLLVFPVLAGFRSPSRFLEVSDEKVFCVVDCWFFLDQLFW